MLSVACLLNRIVGPFATGFLVAAATSVSHSVLAMPLLLLAGAFAYISLPGSDRRLQEMLDHCSDYLEPGVE